jgi:hypothetical protein
VFQKQSAASHKQSKDNPFHLLIRVIRVIRVPKTIRGIPQTIHGIPQTIHGIPQTI